MRRAGGKRTLFRSLAYLLQSYSRLRLIPQIRCAGAWDIYVASSFPAFYFCSMNDAYELGYILGLILGIGAMVLTPVAIILFVNRKRWSISWGDGSRRRRRRSKSENHR
jgi:hypothetical protein